MTPRKRKTSLTPDARMAQTAAARAARSAPEGTTLVNLWTRVPDALAGAVKALSPAERGQALEQYLTRNGGNTMTNYPIEITRADHGGIADALKGSGITHMAEVGRGHSEARPATDEVIVYRLSDGSLVARTNGDPVFEDDDAAGLMALAEECGIDL